MHESHQPSSRTAQALDTASSYLILALASLTPLLFVPVLWVPFQFTKSAFVALAVSAALVAYLVARLLEGALSFPRTWLLAAPWLIPLAYLAASLVSPNIALSFFGNALDVDTTLFMLFMAALFSLAALLPRSGADIFRVYVAVLASAALLGLFTLARVFWGEALSFGVFSEITANIFGKWNDVGVFFGLIALLSVVTLEQIPVASFARAALVGALILSLVLVAFVNLPVVWVVLALFMLGFLVAGLSRRLFRRMEAKRRTASLTAGLILVLSIALLVGGGSVREFLSETLSISYLEARPSWQSTIDVGRSVLGERPIFGSGPNTFEFDWARHKPEGLNATPFWNVGFGSGVGHVPTAFITSGLVGGLAWIVFFLAFLVAGFRALVLRGEGGGAEAYLTLSSFLAALYLWIFTVFYVPNAVLVALAFLFTGLFIASLRGEGSVREARFSFDENPKLGFVLSLLFTVIILAALAGLYAVGVRYAAGTLYQRAAFSLNIAGDVEQAERDIKASLRLAKDPRSYRLAADIALARMNAIVADNPTPSESVRELFQQTLSSALAHGDEAVKRESRSDGNWVSLGDVFRAVVPFRIEGAYENAKLVYEKAIEQSPKNPAIYMRLAQLELARGSTESARGYVKQALSLKGDYTEAVFLLAQLEASEGRIESAISSVEEAVILAPQNPVLFFQLGFLKYTKRDDAGAIEALERAVALNADYANARYFLGLSYARLGRTADAVLQFERVADLNPQNAEVASILANLRAGKSPFAGTPGARPEARTSLPVAE